jgi:hypothetical protein
MRVVMPHFFPKHTLEFKVFEPRAFRRFSFSLVEMAIVTGVLLRVYRLVVLSHELSNWLYLGGTFAIGLIFLIGMTTAHLANFPLHQYLWRAPAFALIEVIAEMAASALLIALGREPHGSVRAHWDDWLGMGVNTLLTRGLIVVLWGVALAIIVHLVRRTLVRDDEEKLEVARSA